MEDSQNNNNHNSKRRPNYPLWITVLAVLIAVLSFIVWVFTNSSSSYISSEIGDNSSSSVNCIAAKPEGSFFASDDVQEVKHNLKILLRNGELDDISYTYDGIYASEKNADNSGAVLHGKYNMYMDEHGADREAYNPVFSLDGTKLKISIYVKKDRLNSVLAPILFLNGEEYNGIHDYNSREFKELYEKKGFTCEIQE